MNYKHIAIIALVLMLALVMPASAVWSNGNWVVDDKKDEYFGNSEVKYDPVTGVESKYNPIVNHDPDRSTYGWIQFMLRSGGSGNSQPGSQIVYVRNMADHSAQPFNSSYYPDGTTFANTNPNWTLIPILADGLSDIKDGLLPGGEFEACIADGNSGQPECQKFTIGNAEITRVAFIGHANSLSTNSDTCTPTITVLDAKYCWDRYIVHHPAYTEYFGDYDKDGSHYDYIGSNMADYDVTFKLHTGWGHGEYDKIGDHYVKHIGWGHGDYDVDHANHVGHTHHSAYDEFVSGDCVDVTPDVKLVVGSGVSSFQMIFDNAPNPGGIFAADGTTLLKPIADPSVGHIKTATIKYNTGCGSPDKTVSKKERQVITLI